jgi:putative two-component system response regulator
LRANNYETVFATDGMSAISVAQKERPDLVVLDLGLPAGDGFTVMERFKAIAPLSVVPIIVVSARDPQVNRDRALKAGAETFLQKPVDNDELLSAIRKALGEPVA